LKKLVIRLRFIYLAIRQVFRLNLGDEVIFKDNKVTLIQGAADPYWSIKDKDGNRKDFVHRKDLKKIVSWYNIKHDLTFIYDFYMGYWYKICQRYKYKTILSFDCSKSIIDS
jgi:hypothetical protein